MNDTNEPAHISAEMVDLHKAGNFIRNYGVRIVWGGILLLAIFIAIFWYSQSVRTKEELASRALFSSRSLHELEEVVEKYDTAKIAPVALLKLAKAYFDSGNYGLANEKYTEFLHRFPKHILAGGAELGRINSIEAMGKIEEAKTLYNEFISKYPDHPGTIMAHIGYARCLEQLGCYTDAYHVYTGIISNVNDSRLVMYVKHLAEPVARQLGIDISLEEETPADNTRTNVNITTYE